MSLAKTEPPRRNDRPSVPGSGLVPDPGLADLPDARAEAARDAAKLRRSRLIGIGLMCCALACFSCLDSLAKYLNHYMSTGQVVWARYTSAFLLAFIISNPWTRPNLLYTKRPWLQLGRALILVSSTAFNITALRYLQLDEALAIFFATPFIVAALSIPMLGERIRWRRWTAILVGFVGVLVVTRPGAGGIHPAALLTLGSSFCYAFYSITTRMLSRTDSNETTLFYSNLVGAVVTTAVLPFVWSTPTDPLVIALMVVMGVFGSLGHWLLIVAHRHAPASVVTPFIYTQIVWVLILGYVVFGDVPNEWTLAGAAIVIASGLYLISRERKVRGEA